MNTGFGISTACILAAFIGLLAAWNLFRYASALYLGLRHKNLTRIQIALYSTVILLLSALLVWAISLCWLH